MSQKTSGPADMPALDEQVQLSSAMLLGKTALVTGSSRGIGASVAQPILVCCKNSENTGKALGIDAILSRTTYLMRELSEGGMHISNADRFVIGASQTLIAGSAEMLSFEQMKGETSRCPLKASGHIHAESRYTS